VQAENGDVFKVSFDWANDVVNRITVKYFETMPIATNMCILKAGFLFLAAEFGNQYGSFFLLVSFVQLPVSN
jgi:splicing factor 3B subunit 3